MLALVGAATSNNDWVKWPVIAVSSALLVANMAVVAKRISSKRWKGLLACFLVPALIALGLGRVWSRDQSSGFTLGVDGDPVDRVA
jgi:hypothetical protein